MMEPMPKEIAEAVCAVMANMRKLPKSERNQHGGYDFASIDAFLAAMNPLCAEAGLFILQDEEACETVQMASKNGPSTWLSMRFAFSLAHKSGAMWGPMHRTVMVQATGAQAFGSAQSYAQKQFMRSLFQIATGEKDDPDFQKAEDLPQRQPAAPKRQPMTTQKPDTPPPNLAVPVPIDAEGSGSDWKRWAKHEFPDRLRACRHEAEIDAVFAANADSLANLRAVSQAAYDAIMAMHPRHKGRAA